VCEVRDQDVARQIALGQSVEIVRSLRERAFQIFAGALVLDQEHAFPERVDASAFELAAGAGDFDLFFEDRDASRIDAEDIEETVPEALCLRALQALTLPLAGKSEGTVFDLVPGKGHWRRMKG
jgi:hypothetical protein